MGASGSVERAAKKTIEAQKQIDLLQESIRQKKDDHEKFFNAEIAKSLAESGLDDAKSLDYNYDIKVEYASEFSLDKIANVVKSALKTAQAAMDPTVPNPATSDKAIESYCDLVNSVSEAAKTTSKTSSNLSYQMTRLSPGMWVFMYSTSQSLYDESLFGSEAITATSIFYKIMQSINDFKNGAAFDSALIDKKNLINMKNIQANLTDDLGAGKITIEEWEKKDTAFTGAVKRLTDRLKGDEFPDRPKPPVNALHAATPLVAGVHANGTNDHGTNGHGTHGHGTNGHRNKNESTVRTAIEVFSAKGAAYSKVVATLNGHLAGGYYN